MQDGGGYAGASRERLTRAAGPAVKPEKLRRVSTSGRRPMWKHLEVDRERALAVLRLGPEATLQQARESYRGLVRSSHPDLIGADGNEAMISLNQAMAIIEEQPDPVVSGADTDAPSVQESNSSEAPIELIVFDDGLTLNAPADELFSRLAEALDKVGDLTYADASSGYLEAAVSMGNPSASQLVVSLQGRGEHTEAFFTLESMGVETPPDLVEVVTAIGAALEGLDPI